ncbi:MAG TPA: acyl-CoA dehydrogenase, partial [Hyphomicrobiales bacterium]|nr:acyl-CoA dehydrogenase [Hyphomicrobiales bacterium]
MSLAETATGTASELIGAAKRAVGSLDQLFAEARMAVDARVRRDGRIDTGLLDQAQHAAHGLAWLATYVEALRQLAAYAEHLDAEGR